VARQLSFPGGRVVVIDRGHVVDADLDSSAPSFHTGTGFCY